MWEKRLKYFNTLKVNNKTSGQILSDINIFKTVWYYPNDGKTDKDMRQT